MRIIKITVNNNEYEFVCDSRDTHYGFAHDCNLLINGYEHIESHCYYLNRTWERYTFESVCVSAISRLIDEYVESEKSAFKSEHGYKKMTAKRLDDFTNELKEHARYNEYKAVKDKLTTKMY